MLRSVLNGLLRDADAFFRENHVFLPQFAYWSPAEWAARGAEVEEIVQCRLGWDVTDYGLDDFHHYGLILFTLRNGRPGRPGREFSKPYCEKAMIAEVGQMHQMHMHLRKMEDIINRGGGTLAMQLYRASSGGGWDKVDVRVNLDGVWRTLPAGSIVRLHPGESITLTPRLYHRFWAEGETVLMGEVSSVNDDHTDNRFYPLIGTGRFTEIKEDARPLYVLARDYETYWSHPRTLRQE